MDFSARASILESACRREWIQLSKRALDVLFHSVWCFNDYRHTDDEELADTNSGLYCLYHDDPAYGVQPYLPGCPLSERCTRRLCGRRCLADYFCRGIQVCGVSRKKEEEVVTALKPPCQRSYMSLARRRFCFAILFRSRKWLCMV